MSAARTLRSIQFGAPGVTPQSLGIPTAAYPGRIATNADLTVAVDQQQTSLALPLTSTATLMTVSNPAVIAAYSLLSIDSELVLATGPPPGNAVPISRGFDGTTPAIHVVGASVLGQVDAWHHNALVAEVEAIEQTLGPNLSRIPSSPLLAASSFNFAAQTPGGNLTAGTNAITLTPVPPGVNGSDAGHWLYISGGTGAPEAVKITGGAAVARAASGVIFVSCANTHSGAWTISSATGGVAEAQQSIASSAGSSGIVYILGATFHAPVTSIAGSVVTFIGPGIGTYVITRASDFPPSSAIFLNATTAGWTFKDMTVYQGTGASTSTAFQLNGGNNILVNVRVFNGAYGIAINGSALTMLRGVIVQHYDQSFKATAALYITGGVSNVFISDSAFGGGPDNANLVNYGCKIDSADGVVISNSGFTADYAVAISPTAPNFVADVIFTGCLIDGFRTYGVLMNGTGGLGDIRFTGCHNNGQAGNGWMATGPGVYLLTGANSSVVDVEFNGGTIAGCDGTGLYIGPAAGPGRSIKITAVTIGDNNRGNHANFAGVEIAPGAAGVTFIGNTVQNWQFGHQTYSVRIQGALSDSIISANNLGTVAGGEVVTTPLVIGGALTRVIIGLNQGVNLSTGVGAPLASAATITPTNEAHHVTGTAAIATIAVPAGFTSGQLVLIPDAVFTWSAAGNIAVAGTSVAHRALAFTYDASSGDWYPSYVS